MGHNKETLDNARLKLTRELDVCLGKMARGYIGAILQRFLDAYKGLEHLDELEKALPKKAPKKTEEPKEVPPVVQ